MNCFQNSSLPTVTIYCIDTPFFAGESSFSDFFKYSQKKETAFEKETRLFALSHLLSHRSHRHELCSASAIAAGDGKSSLLFRQRTQQRAEAPAPPPREGKLLLPSITNSRYFSQYSILGDIKQLSSKKTSATHAGNVEKHSCLRLELPPRSRSKYKKADTFDSTKISALWLPLLDSNQRHFG